MGLLLVTGKKKARRNGLVDQDHLLPIAISLIVLPRCNVIVNRFSMYVMVILKLVRPTPRTFCLAAVYFLFNKNSAYVRGVTNANDPNAAVGLTISSSPVIVATASSQLIKPGTRFGVPGANPSGMVLLLIWFINSAIGI